MESTSTSKTIVAVVIIAIIGGLMYWSLSSGDESSITSDTPLGGDYENTQLIGADIRDLLAQLNSLKIDADFFNDPVYKDLVDYRTAIPAQKVGRVNPFAPLTKN